MSFIDVLGGIVTSSDICSMSLQFHEWVRNRSSSRCFYWSISCEKGYNQIRHPSTNLNSVNHSMLPPTQSPFGFIPSMPTTSEPNSFDWFSFADINGRSSDLSSNPFLSGESASKLDVNDFSKHVPKYISKMLLEENTEEKLCTFCDPLALQATEKSLYDVISDKHPAPPSHNQNPPAVCQNDQNPVLPFLKAPCDCGCGDFNRTGSISFAENSSDKQTLADSPENNHISLLMSPSDYFHIHQFNTLSNSRSPSGLAKSFAHDSDQTSVSGEGEFPFLCTSLGSSSSKFERGMQEARKFLPDDIKLIGATKGSKIPQEMKRDGLNAEIIGGKKEQESPLNGWKGRKNYEREEAPCERACGRVNKQVAASLEVAQLSEMFDSILLCTEDKTSRLRNDAKQNSAAQNADPDRQARSSSSRGIRARKHNNKVDTIDLRNLLILCAQAISVNDIRNASELVKQIRLHSSPKGSGSQRLAHCFANGLEARLAGIGVQGVFTSLTTKKLSASTLIKYYRTYCKACPFVRMTISFANNMIAKIAETATTLHIIDFGISFGFKWPMLIQILSMRPGGPPNLRLTMIELPQPGFKPEERILEIGHHLGSYCERFGVPFHYNAILTHRWETIKVEELKINKNEVLAVNCLYRFENLLDETTVLNNPRDAVLNTIREMNPDIFVHSVINGSYSAPFFVTRFREAVFHFSALFDMFDCNLPRNNKERILIEQEYLGRQAMNVISCESSQRVERPETYKQWQARIMQAGFKQLPLNRKLMKIYKDALEAHCHKDFVIDESANWLLQGWKGRILYASCSWVPA